MENWLPPERLVWTRRLSRTYKAYFATSAINLSSIGLTFHCGDTQLFVMTENMMILSFIS